LVSFVVFPSGISQNPRQQTHCLLQVRLYEDEDGCPLARAAYTRSPVKACKSSRAPTPISEHEQPAQQEREQASTRGWKEWLQRKCRGLDVDATHAQKQQRNCDEEQDETQPWCVAVGTPLRMSWLTGPTGGLITALHCLCQYGCGLSIDGHWPAAGSCGRQCVGACGCGAVASAAGATAHRALRAALYGPTVSTGT
jgi:hypothetical protein